MKNKIVIPRKRRNSITLEDDLNGCIPSIMDKVARASQAIIGGCPWTRSAKTLALMVVGIILSGTAVLQRIAEQLHLEGISAAKMVSIERRLARFVANERVQVSKIWKLFLTQVLAYWKGKPVQLVLDCTPFDAPLGHRVSGTAGAFAGVASRVGHHASPRALAARAMGAGGRAAG